MADPRPGARPDEGIEDDFAYAESEHASGDVDSLLALARSYRAGTAPGGRDLQKSYEAYAAAASRGSAEAEFAVAVFHLSGGVVPQDLQEGAAHLRVAADKGSVPAKVYLGNLYELGVHYKQDFEKADVWYRNAARAARIEHRPETDDYVRALAELGSVRHVGAILDGGQVDEATSNRLLARAKAHGQGLRLRDANRPSAIDSGPVPSFTPTEASAGSAAAPGRASVEPTPAPSVAAPEPAPARGATEVAPAVSAKSAKSDVREPRVDKPAKARAASGPTTIRTALAAFAYAALFLATGTGVGVAATLGAEKLVADGQVLPVIGARAALLFPAGFALFGVLPLLLVYRASAVAKGVVVGSVAAGGAWFAWGAGYRILDLSAELQAGATGLATLALTLFVLGCLGGAKKTS